MTTKKTPWYPRDVEPVRKGWYEGKASSGVWLSTEDGKARKIAPRYWNGKVWKWRNPIGQLNRATIWHWRGLTKEAKK